VRLSADGLIQEPLSRELFSGAEPRTVACAGDTDGDELDDWLVAATREDQQRAYTVVVLSGLDGSLLRTIDSPSPCHDLEFGASLAGAGDLDGDGRADYVIAAPTGFTPSDLPEECRVGHVFVYSGESGVLLFDLEHPGTGYTLDGGMDATGDGVPDILVGSDHQGLVLGARLYSGKDGSIVREIEGDIFREYIGANVALLDDMDGDGCAELAVANHPTGCCVPRSGEVIIYSGKTGARLHSLRSGR
jgi:hypothetical protein